jgi:hypothetical protein
MPGHPAQCRARRRILGLRGGRTRPEVTCPGPDSTSLGLDDHGSGQLRRFGEPLAPARLRPPYVRNHCYAAAHSGTP